MPTRWHNDIMSPCNKPTCDINITPPILRVSFSILDCWIKKAFGNIYSVWAWNSISKVAFVQKFQESIFYIQEIGFYYSLCFHFYYGFACGIADGKSITSTGSRVLGVKSWFSSWESKYILLQKWRNSISFDKDRVSFKQVIFCLNQLHSIFFLRQLLLPTRLVQ